MKQKTYFILSGTVFLIVAVVHALRLINGWDIVIGETTLPMYVSWLGVLLGGYLAYLGLSKK